MKLCVKGICESNPRNCYLISIPHTWSSDTALYVVEDVVGLALDSQTSYQDIQPVDVVDNVCDTSEDNNKVTRMSPKV